MELTYLGHAGFCVETEQSVIIMDPWLSPTGAFDSAWFQFPCNHHLAAFVQTKLRNTKKACYIYISHEHKERPLRYDLSAQFTSSKLHLCDPTLSQDGSVRTITDNPLQVNYLVRGWREGPDSRGAADPVLGRL